jgi:hypothetical protein
MIWKHSVCGVFTTRNMFRPVVFWRVKKTTKTLRLTENKFFQSPTQTHVDFKFQFEKKTFRLTYQVPTTEEKLVPTTDEKWNGNTVGVHGWKRSQGSFTTGDEFRFTTVGRKLSMHCSESQPWLICVSYHQSCICVRGECGRVGCGVFTHSLSDYWYHFCFCSHR